MKTTLKLSACLLIAGMLFGSCDRDHKKGGMIGNPDPLKLSGSIAGKVLDRCSGGPIAGVKVSVAGKTSVTTNGNGEFIFTNVPVNADYSFNGTGTIWNSYVVLFDFVNYNKNKPDSLKYPNYDQQDVDVAFTDLNDGDNGSGSVGGESGSGADTPVEGLVSHIEVYSGRLTSTITGQIVDQVNYDPVSGATVYLKGTNSAGVTTVIATTTTNGSGTYTFTKVENGESFTIEGWNTSNTMSGSVGINLTCGQNGNLNSQVTAQRIVLGLTDNVAPFMTSISPENNSDVAANVSIIYTFSEPIKQTAYTRTDLPKGNGTIVDDITFTYLGMKKAAGAVNFTAAWNGNFDQLTLTPSGQTGAARYAISYAAGIAAKLTDAKGNALANAGTAIIGDFLNGEALNFTTAGNSAVPAVPVLFKDSLITAITSVNWNGGSVKLKWTVDESAVRVKFFEILKKVGNGQFDIMATNVRTSDTTLTITAADMGTNGTNNPRTVGAVSYQVRAISENLVVGDVSNTMVSYDRSTPQVTAADSNGFDTNGNPVIRVLFNEPLNETFAESAGNYQFSNNAGNNTPTTALQAVYVGYNGATWEVRLSVDPATLIYGSDVLTVNTPIRDISGNLLRNAPVLLTIAP